jgi:hypothetical protein
VEDEVPGELDFRPLMFVDSDMRPGEMPHFGSFVEGEWFCEHRACGLGEIEDVILWAAVPEFAHWCGDSE